MEGKLAKIANIEDKQLEFTRFFSAATEVKITNFCQIKQYFDALNQDESHFVNSNDICTPMDCVKEMVDAIPTEFWQRKNIKILDSCCGNGNFHAYIQTKTKLENLYFNEINQKRINNLKNYFGDDINITIEDFLKFDNKQEYDLVVSNPPYAKFNENGRTSKNHNLARDFIKKALDITKDNGYILFIVPNNWMSFSDRNILPQELSKYQFIYLDIHGAKKWFPKVGSSFTWFLLHKIPNQKSFTVKNSYIIKDQQNVKIDINQNFIPLYLSQTVYNILEKTLNNNSLPRYKVETTSYLHKTTQKNLISNFHSKEFCHKLIHTPTQIVWSKKPHKYQDGWKVFISLTNQYSTFVDNCGMTQSIAFVRCNSKKEAEEIKNELDSNIFKFLNNITRYGNFNNIRILQQFPKLNSFALDSEELAFITKFNNKYYGKKEK
jgi:adenine-specific DNA-methyltransferase